MVDVGSALNGIGPMVMGYAGMIVYWIGIILFAVVLVGVLLFGYYYFSFKYKATIFELSGSGNNLMGIGKIKRNKIKWNKKKTCWKTLFPLFNKVEHKPFDSEYIYPGNNIFACEVNGVLQPAEANIIQEKLCLQPVEHHIREWQGFQHKKNAEETAKQDFWSQNKDFFMVIGTALFCCVLVGATIYFTYKFATTGTGEIRGLADAIRGITQAAGR